MISPHRHRLNQRGLTLVELAITAGFLATAGLWASKLMAKPAMIQNMMFSYDLKKSVDAAANQFTTDIQAADPGSIVWANVPPNSTTGYSSFSFSEPRYTNLSAATPTSTPLPVVYAYVPGSDGQGSLVRTANGVDRTIVSSMYAPTAAMPLVAQDTTTYHLLVFQISYRPIGSQTPIKILRRVALAG